MMNQRSVYIAPPKLDHTVFTQVQGIWQYKELLLALALKDIAIRYKQTILGILWAMLQPLLTCLAFTVVFRHVIPAHTISAPYPVFVFSGLLLWQFFSRNLLDGSNSLNTQAALITKIYFSRLIIPLASILSSTIDFCITLLILFAMMAYYHMTPSWHILMVPFVLLMALVLSYSISLILAPINAIYRDICIALPFAIQILMYLSPIIYPVSFIPQRFQWLYQLSPIVTLLDTMRWALIGSPPPSATGILVFICITCLIFCCALLTFKFLEPTIVDRI